MVVELREYGEYLKTVSVSPVGFNPVPVDSSTCIYIIVFVYLYNVIFSGNPFMYECSRRISYYKRYFLI
jgi:hypothetical protein